MPIRINLIAPPLYVITTSTPEKQEGLDALNNACKAIEERIMASGGSFNIQMAPKVVTATDEADLAKQLERAEQENAEVWNQNKFLTMSHFTIFNLIFFSRFPVTMMRKRKKLEWAARFLKVKKVMPVVIENWMMNNEIDFVLNVNIFPHIFVRRYSTCFRSFKKKPNKTKLGNYSSVELVEGICKFCKW